MNNNIAPHVTSFYRRTAKRLFVHYMTVTWKHIGLSVDGDNIAEWEDIVDFIIAAAREAPADEGSEQDD